MKLLLITIICLSTIGCGSNLFPQTRISANVKHDCWFVPDEVILKYLYGFESRGEEGKTYDAKMYDLIEAYDYIDSSVESKDPAFTCLATILDDVYDR